jgi:hypothetical protein
MPSGNSKHSQLAWFPDPQPTAVVILVRSWSGRPLLKRCGEIGHQSAARDIAGTVLAWWMINDRDGPRKVFMLRMRADPPNHHGS